MQLTYNTDPAVGREGMIADSRIVRQVNSRLAETAIHPGKAVLRGAARGLTVAGGPGGVAGLTATPAVASDDDAVITGTIFKSSAAVLTTYLAAVADGVVAGARMVPPRKLTVIFDGSADWDATTGNITFEDNTGKIVTETLSVATSASLTTTGYASRFISVSFPAQTGAGGTAKIGISTAGALTGTDVEGVAVLDASLEPRAPLYTTPEYATGMAVPVLRKGAIFVVPEMACDPSSGVYVRVVTSGAQIGGSFRADDDTSTAVLLVAARYLAANVTGGASLNIVELDLV